IFCSSCLLVISVCLFGSGHAQSDDEFTTEKERLLVVYGNPSIDEATRYRNVADLVSFYEKYSNRLSLPPKFNGRAQDLLRRYKHDNCLVLHVDGVPAQGGFWLPLVKLLILQLGVEIASEAVKRATAS
ncbi:hypothetical protein KR084_000876, partial [Drosophila pseudotakahashii]